MNKRRILIGLNMMLMLTALWLSMTAGRIQGPPANPDAVVRNIIYVHVPSAICAMLCFVVLLAASVMVLVTSPRIWDHTAAATAEVGTIFAIVLNITGSIFSRAEWGLWWTPSPRLVSAAMLAFLYVVYLILRSSITGSVYRKARICAVYGIIAFLDVPLVYISARYLPDIHRASFSFDTAGQRAAFFISVVAVLLLAGLLIWLRTDVLRVQSRIHEQF